MRKPALLMYVAAASAAVAVGLAAGSGADDRTVPSSAGQPSPASRPVDPARIYSVFRETSARSNMSADARARAEGSVPKAVVPDPAYTRLVASDTGARLYVVAGGGAVCQWQEGPLDAGGLPRWAGGSCGWLSDRLADRQPSIGVTYLAQDRWRVGGLVPDGIDEIVVTLADGSRERLAVTRNAVTAELAEKPTAIDWTAPDGSRGSSEAWLEG